MMSSDTNFAANTTYNIMSIDMNSDKIMSKFIDDIINSFTNNTDILKAIGLNFDYISSDPVSESPKTDSISTPV